MSQRSALVCSGGGALGVTLLGIIEKIQKSHTFEWYSGVSVGAIITSFLACGFTPREIFDIFEKTSLLSLSFDFSPSNFGILKGQKTYDILEENLGQKTFEDLETPLFIGATDFLTGERVTLSSGKIVDALRASISIPVLFEPYHHPGTGKWLVDGGLSQNLPLDLALSNYSGESIFALDLAGLRQDIDFTDKKLFAKNKTIAKTLGRTFKIFFQNQQTSFPLDPRVKHFQIAPPFESFDVFKISEMYDWGVDYAEKNIS